MVPKAINPCKKVLHACGSSAWEVETEGSGGHPWQYVRLKEILLQKGLKKKKRKNVGERERGRRGRRNVGCKSVT